jgi:hypothetical protein
LALAVKLDKFQETIVNSFSKLEGILNELNKKLPNSIVVLDDLSKINNTYIYNEFNHCFSEADILVNDIKNFIHYYYDVDNTLKNKSSI